MTFDLTGLPPTLAEVGAFLKDRSSEAFEKVVERLLGSPHYGERWGRHWLDLVRYADTAGDSADYPVPQAHKYRDYVIAAFNREQLAGDLLPFTSQAQRNEQVIATGYIAISRRFATSGKVAHLTIEDTLETTGRAFLGLSLSCARCHDHKYDPITMQDYYALNGIFASTRYPHAGAEKNRRSWPIEFGNITSVAAWWRRPMTSAAAELRHRIPRCSTGWPRASSRTAGR